MSNFTNIVAPSAGLNQSIMVDSRRAFLSKHVLTRGTYPLWEWRGPHMWQRLCAPHQLSGRQWLELMRMGRGALSHQHKAPASDIEPTETKPTLNQKIHKPLIVSFHTRDPRYNEHAKIWLEHVNAQGYESLLESFEPFASWNEACHAKLMFLDKIWHQVRRPFVWLDVDARLMRPIDTLFAWNPDLAFAYGSSDLFQSGAMYIGSRPVVGRWLSLAKSLAGDNFALNDQMHLDHAWAKLTAPWPGRWGQSDLVGGALNVHQTIGDEVEGMETMFFPPTINKIARSDDSGLNQVARKVDRATKQKENIEWFLHLQESRAQKKAGRINRRLFYYTPAMVWRRRLMVPETSNFDPNLFSLRLMRMWMECRGRLSGR